MVMSKKVSFVCHGNYYTHDVEITEEDLNEIAIKKVLSLYSHVEEAKVINTVIETV